MPDPDSRLTSLPSINEIRLPLSRKYRSSVCFLKLLKWVRTPASSGFDFEGVFLTPGAIVAGKELRPSVDYPETPTLLECAGIIHPVRMRDPHGEKRSEYLYVLWQLDRGGSWKELARALSTSWDWALDLGNMAARAIEDHLEAPDLEKVEKRIAAYLNFELQRVSKDDQEKMLSVIHDQLAFKIHPSPFGRRNVETKLPASV